MSLLHQLFPQVRAELFRLLFADAGRELHGRDLARQCGFNAKTVQDELGKLSRADLVTSRRDGNRRYFRASANHPVFVDLQQIVLKTAGLRAVLADALAAVEGIEVAFVFGSLAGGPGKAASDVDLLVIGDATSAITRKWRALKVAGASSSRREKREQDAPATLKPAPAPGCGSGGRRRRRLRC